MAGSISKQSNGRWQVRYRVGGERGTPQRKRTFPTKKEGRDYLAGVEVKQATGAYVDPRSGKVTFGSWYEDWLIMTAPRWRPSTLSQVRTYFGRHVVPVLGDRHLGAIKRPEVQALVTGLSRGVNGRKALASATVHTIGAHMSRCFADAVDARLIPESPWRGVVLPAKDDRDVVPLTLDQVEALAEAMRPDLAALVVVGVGSGLRPGELAGLTVDRVQGLGGSGRLAVVGAPGVIEVRQQMLSPDAGAARLGPLKTPKSKRDVPVAPYVVEAIRAHLDAFGEGEGGLVFHWDGAPMRRQRLNGAWRKAASAAGVPSTPHLMRHTYASALIRAGLSVPAVSRLLGHQSESVTLDVYSHMWPGDDDRARDAVASMFVRPDEVAEAL
jgi:integrase